MDSTERILVCVGLVFSLFSLESIESLGCWVVGLLVLFLKHCGSEKQKLYVNFPLFFFLLQ